MAITSRKITTYVKNIVDLSDTPNKDGLTAAQLKAFFDGRTDEEVKASINGIVDDLVATTDGASGADQVGATPVGGGTGNTVQEVLEEIDTNLEEIDTNAVHKTGDETVAGVKTFSSSPIVPTPTTDMQASTKKYVDDKDTVRKAYVDSKDGDLTTLTTTEKGSLVGAINEVDSHADTNATSIGTLASLTTTEKTNLVGATNEVKNLVDTIDSRVDTIITTPVDGVSAQEIIDARQGETTLGANLTSVKTQLADIVTLIYPTMTTNEIQEKLNLGGSFRFKSGLYTLDLISTGLPLLTCLSIQSNSNITLEEGVILTTPANDQTIFTILGIYNKSNITIIGGEIVGERATHLGVTGEWGMGLSIYSSTNITINNVKIKDNWGDGLYITSSVELEPVNKNIKINGVICDNNRRQGMSVESVDGLFVTNSQFINTNGISPQGGIDFELYLAYHYINNIYITDCLFKDNVGYGILIAKYGTIATQSHDMFMQISNCNFEGNDFVISNFKEGCNGEIKLNNPNFKNCRIKRMFTSNKFPKLLLNNVTMIDPCYGESSGTEFDKSAILLYNVTGETRTITDGTGNIEINGLRIVETTNIATSSIYLYDNVLNAFYDIHLSNIKKFTPNGFYGSNRIINSDKVLNLNFDNSPFFKISPTAYTMSLDKTILASNIDNTGLVGSMFIKLTNEYPLFKPISIMVKTANLIIIEPLDGTTFFTPVNMRSNVIGNGVTIMKISATNWIVINQNGTWTTV